MLGICISLWLQMRIRTDEKQTCRGNMVTRAGSLRIIRLGKAFCNKYKFVFLKGGKKKKKIFSISNGNGTGRNRFRLCR